MWDPSDGRLLQTLEGPGGSVDWVKWHPKGNVVLAGSEDFTMWMWLAQTGSCMQVSMDCLAHCEERWWVEITTEVCIG